MVEGKSKESIGYHRQCHRRHMEALLRETPPLYIWSELHLTRRLANHVAVLTF